MQRVLIVEDMTETRAWLVEAAGAAFPGCAVVEAATVAAGLAAAARDRFDMALIDLRMPDGSGLEVLRALKGLAPDTIGAVTTVIADDADIVAALAAGADGYLLKQEAGGSVVRQLHRLAEGVPVLSPSIARRIMEHFRYTGPAAQADEALTPRESEVLSLIGSGLRNTEAARALGVGESTVASHIKSIYRKLGISSRAEAAWHASRMGLRPDSTR